MKVLLVRVSHTGSLEGNITYVESTSDDSKKYMCMIWVEGMIKGRDRYTIHAFLDINWRPFFTVKTFFPFSSPPQKDKLPSASATSYVK